MIKILDCTLRDGGYYTNWDFDADLTLEYFKLANLLPLDYLEVGYRSIIQEEYYGEFFFMPISTFQKISSLTDKKISIMINAKDFIDVDVRSIINDTKDYVSLVRIAIQPNNIEFGIELAISVKSMGFEVGLNIMQISTLDADHILFDHLKGIENFVDYLYLVDSYGSIYPEELREMLDKVQSQTNVDLGFHGHNNVELAFANSIVAINNNVSIIDATVLGMGRGAGNLKLELILGYLNSKREIKVDLNLLGRYVELFYPLLDIHRWGINLAYIVSGCYSLPQKEVMDALEINRYSLSGIVSKLRSNLKLQLPEYAPTEETKSCLIVGGGSTIRKHIGALTTYLSKNRNIVLLHATSRYLDLFSDLKNKQYFAMTGDELLKLEPISGIHKYILGPDLNTTENIRYQPESLYQLKEISFTSKYPDSPLSAGLQIALEMSCQSIYLAGFDGYEELKNKKDLYLMNENQDILNIFSSNYSVVSLTPTKYKNIKQQSIYCKI